MKKYFSLAAGATLLIGATIGMAHPVSAQTAPAATTGAASGPFADVPADHWAYQAVNTLQKAGIVIGYPDGTYGGRRAMTRYEFAVAIARLLPMIQQPIDTSQFVQKSDFQAFQDDVNGKLQSQQQALDALSALVHEFQPELERLGADVTAIQARLDADEQRLAVVEDEQRRLKITGEANFIARSNINTNSGEADPLDKDGYRVGTTGNRSLFNNINVYHDILLNFDGRVSDTAHLIVKLDASNYLPSLGSYEALDPYRTYGTSTPADQFSVYQAYLDAPVNLGGLSGAEVVVGRFGEQFTPFTLKAIDPDSYTYLPETDSGDVGTDGFKLNFGLAGAHASFYAGKNNVDDGILTGGPSYYAKDGQYRPGSIVPGSVQYDNVIDQSAGGRITFGNPDTFVVGVTGLLARETAQGVQATPGPFGSIFESIGAPTDPYSGTAYNNLLVYGVDFQGTLPFVKKSGLTLDGEFANSATGYNNQFANVNGTKGTEAYYAELGYTFGPVNIKGGYKEVYNNFDAPGYWGKIGSYTNPQNIRGPIVHASYAITPTLSLVGDGNFFKGIYNLGDQSPLGSDDDLTSYDVGLKYGLTSSYNVDLGYEWAQWNLKNDQGLLLNAGKPTEQYITIGVGHTLSANASLKLLYQIIEYSDNGTGFDPAAGGGDEHGGVAVTQFSVKF